jgi:hypothetical protein
MIIHMEIVKWKISIAIFLKSSPFYIYIYACSQKNRRLFFFALSRSVHFLFSRSLYSIHLICFCFGFYSSSGLSVRLILDFIGHRDRSETHPAYLPTFLGEIIIHAYLYIFSLSLYIFFFML